MKELQLNSDITLVALKAKSFPAGVGTAFNELEQKVGGDKGRAWYGLSQADGKRDIAYWACVQSKPVEKLPAGCESLTVRAGTYISEQLSDWRGREKIVSETFRKIISSPKVDPNGYCVEKYLDNGDVLCMVRIIPSR
jgi:predicted transcriptional regulator YdeE